MLYVYGCFEHMGDTIAISIDPDENGYIGRECPECEGYFKITPGTGLEGDVPCHCPYCGAEASQDEYFTKEQIEYAKSVALNQITGSLIKQMKKMEVKSNPRDFISMSISVKGKPHPISYYREQKLEQEVECENCTLRYSIFGVFGYCPDCGVHNSYQILISNYSVVRKMLAFAVEQEVEVSKKLIENALEDAVSAFDGFGRELVANYYSRHSLNNKKPFSFQNIIVAKDKLFKEFSVDIKNELGIDNFSRLSKLFQKRHLHSHKMGVMDDEYINKTGGNRSQLGKVAAITIEEVEEILLHLSNIGEFLFKNINSR